MSIALKDINNEFSSAVSNARAEYRRLADIAAFSLDDTEKAAAEQTMQSLAFVFGLSAVNPTKTKFSVGEEVIGTYDSHAPGGYRHYVITDTDLRGIFPKYWVREIKSELYTHLHNTKETLLSESELSKAPRLKYGDIVSIANKEKYITRLDVDKMYAVSGYGDAGRKYMLLGIPNILTFCDEDLELVQPFPRDYKVKEKK